MANPGVTRKCRNQNIEPETQRKGHECKYKEIEWSDVGIQVIAQIGEVIGLYLLSGAGAAKLRPKSGNRLSQLRSKVIEVCWLEGQREGDAIDLGS